jgi:hypothetical protein
MVPASSSASILAELRLMSLAAAAVKY